MLTLFDNPVAVTVTSYNEDNQRAIMLGISEDKLDAFCIHENGRIGLVPFTAIAVVDADKTVDAAHKMISVTHSEFTHLFDQQQQQRSES